MLRIDAYHMHTKTASYARQQISYHMYVKSEYYMRAKRMPSIYTPKSIVECQYQEFFFLFGVLLYTLWDWVQWSTIVCMVRLTKETCLLN